MDCHVSDTNLGEHEGPKKGAGPFLSHPDPLVA